VSDSEVSGLKVGMRWEKSAPSNLFPIAGIPVDRSSDKQVLTVLGIDNGIDLIVKTQENISKLSLVLGRAELLYHSCCFSCECGAEMMLSLSNILQTSMPLQ